MTPTEFLLFKIRISEFDVALSTPLYAVADHKVSMESPALNDARTESRKLYLSVRVVSAPLLLLVKSLSGFPTLLIFHL